MLLQQASSWRWGISRIDGGKGRLYLLYPWNQSKMTECCSCYHPPPPTKKKKVREVSYFRGVARYNESTWVEVNSARERIVSYTTYGCFRFLLSHLFLSLPHLFQHQYSLYWQTVVVFQLISCGNDISTSYRCPYKAHLPPVPIDAEGWDDIGPARYAQVRRVKELISYWASIWPMRNGG